MREIWQALATEFRRRKVARTGTGVRDVLVDFRDLLVAAGCNDGDERAAAEHALREAMHEGWLTLETHRRDASLPTLVRLPLSSEATLFSRLGETTPRERREAVARQFEAAAQTEVPVPWHDAWRTWCLAKAAAVRTGGALGPFHRENTETNAEVLALLPRLLGWRGESLIRFASCVLCGHSKRLAQLAGSATYALGEITGGHIVSLDGLGILENPRSVLVHGPLQLQLEGAGLDFGQLHGPIRLSGVDVQRAEIVATTATRCLTVENETSFYELAKLQSGELLVQTSYPGSATLGLLARLPTPVELWHFGDTDPEGFDILRDLRERLGREVRALHMAYRPSSVMQPLSSHDHRMLRRLLGASALSDLHPVLLEILRAESLGHWEQEGLGRPTLSQWPFYGIDHRVSYSR